MHKPGFQFDHSYARLPEQMFARQAPVPVSAPRLVLFNHDLAAGLGLDFAGMDADLCAAICAGNHVPDGAMPLAMAYAGHQFGHFTMLGDGRALLWGEHLCPDGRRVDLQWKGSGRTVFARNGDGRAALGPMLREYVISEAMAALGIPTTRALAVAATGDEVYRDIPLPGAVLLRVAASHIRVGTFEYIAGLRDIGLLRQMVDYTLARHDPGLVAGAERPAIVLLQAVMARQAALITDWVRVGFVHGVMNTDNVAISGETIDYGPCAFMDHYDPATVFSSIDRGGRYAFGRQVTIAQWNMARFAESLLPLLDDDPARAVAVAEQMVVDFGADVRGRIAGMMAARLGLVAEDVRDAAMVEDLLGWMRAARADYIQTFRDLSLDVLPVRAMYQEAAFRDWYHAWAQRLAEGDTPPAIARRAMRALNPAVIPRNHRVEEALAAAGAGNLAPLQDLLARLARPYDDAADDWLGPPPPGQICYQTFCGT